MSRSLTKLQIRLAPVPLIRSAWSELLKKHRLSLVFATLEWLSRGPDPIERHARIPLASAPKAYITATTVGDLAAASFEMSDGRQGAVMEISSIVAELQDDIVSESRARLTAWSTVSQRNPRHDSNGDTHSRAELKYCIAEAADRWRRIRHRAVSQAACGLPFGGRLLVPLPRRIGPDPARVVLAIRSHQTTGYSSVDRRPVISRARATAACSFDLSKARSGRAVRYSATRISPSLSCSNSTCSSSFALHKINPTGEASES